MFAIARKFLAAGILLYMLVLMMSSCSIPTRKLTYMQGAFDTAKLSHVNAIEPTIRKGDIISIIVYSDNPEATKIYNQSLIVGASSGSSTVGVSQGVSGSSPSSGGYQVDENGNIVFQGLGIMHVEGLNKAQLKDTLDARLKPFLTNAYYNIRFVNYKFTMIGEVTRPGIISIPGEKINLVEAIAMAGDLTYYGRRDNITVIRETNGKREWARLNLLKPEIMASPYYYLQQNDIVYVEADKKKSGATDQTLYRNITIVATLVSMFAILYSIFK